MNLRVVLCDDHKSARTVMRLAVQRQPMAEVVGETESGVEALSLVRKLKPNLAIIDIALPDMNGLRVAQLIKQYCRNIGIIIVSGYVSKTLVQLAQDTGVQGYVGKLDDIEEIAGAIDAVAKGGSYYCDAARNALTQPGPDFRTLTQREWEVLRFLRQGKDAHAMAIKAHLTMSTANTHLRTAIKKLDVHDIVELMHLLSAEGVMDVDITECYLAPAPPRRKP